MGSKTKIQWTATVNADGSTTEGASWNPIRARNRTTGAVGWHCTKPSAGCKNCYAESINKRLGTGLSYIIPAGKQVDIVLDEKILMQPLHWKKPRKIFPCSMTDWLGEFVPSHMVYSMLAVMSQSPTHVFQCLTKRAERAARILCNPSLGEFIDESAVDLGWCHASAEGRLPFPNVWVGFSAENQETFDERWEHMRKLAAAGWLVWCSYEPALGPIDMRAALAAGLRWVVVGFESGAHARPGDIAWVRSMIAQCKEANCACFIKQFGAWVLSGTDDGFAVNRYLMPDGSSFSPPIIGPNAFKRPEGAIGFSLFDRKGGRPEEWPKDTRVREFPQSPAHGLFK